jgi:hypothetical protein
MNPFSLDHIFSSSLAAQPSGKSHRALALRLSGATWTDSAPLRFILPYVVKEQSHGRTVSLLLLYAATSAGGMGT